MIAIFEFLTYLVIEFLLALPGTSFRTIHLNASRKKAKQKEYSTSRAGWYYIAGLLLIMIVSLSIQLSH